MRELQGSAPEDVLRCTLTGLILVMTQTIQMPES